MKEKLLVLAACIITACTVFSQNADRSLMAENTGAVIRGWNYNTVQVGENTYRTEFSAKQINYLDKQNTFQPIRPAFNKTTGGFVMAQAPFTVTAPLTSNGIAQFINNNRFDVTTETTINEPDLTMAIQAMDVSAVEGEIEESDLGWGKVSYVIYKNAYPEYDADLIYWVQHGKTPRLKKLIRFNSLAHAPKAETPFSFRIFYDKEVYIQTQANGEMTAWASKEPLLAYQGSISAMPAESKLKNSDAGKRAIAMNEFRIWDSGHTSLAMADASAKKQKGQLIRVSLVPEEETGAYIFSKIIPGNFFSNAVFPVYTDATLDCGAAAGDGLVQYWNTTSWGTAHDAASGTYNGGNGYDYASTDATVGTWTNGGGSWQIIRVFLPIATTALSGSATVTSASLWLYGTQWGLNTSSMCMVRQTQANVLSLSNSDYSQISSTQKIASDKSSGDWGGGSYLEWPLTDLSYINPGGYTKIGLRTIGDYNNSAPSIGGAGGVGISIRTSEYAPAGTNPKLVVTYTLPPTVPVLANPTATSVTNSAATLGAEVTSDGGASVTGRGVCWGTSPAPSANCISEGGTGIGVFTKAVNGLPPGTLVYYRGYATNSVGTGYSPDGSFTTGAATPVTVDWNNGNVQEIILSDSRAFTFANGQSGGEYNLIIKQNGTGGWSATWAADIGWASGVSPALSTSPNAIDLVKFIYDGARYLGHGITLDIKH